MPQYTSLHDPLWVLVRLVCLYTECWTAVVEALLKCSVHPSTPLRTSVRKMNTAAPASTTRRACDSIGGGEAKWLRQAKWIEMKKKSTTHRPWFVYSTLSQIIFYLLPLNENIRVVLYSYTANHRTVLHSTGRSGRVCQRRDCGGGDLFICKPAELDALYCMQLLFSICITFIANTHLSMRFGCCQKFD